MVVEPDLRLEGSELLVKNIDDMFQSAQRLITRQASYGVM